MLNKLFQAANRAIKVLSLAGAAVLLGAQALGQTLTDDKLGVFAVPRAARPPVIDGTIAPQEWGGALALSGLAQQNPGGNLLIMRPTTFYLMWDDDNLYLACRTWIMPGYKPRVSGRSHNTATAFDDGLEFNIMSLGKNVSEAGSDSSYKFFINALGTLGDMGRVSVGQIFRTWQPRFEIAVRQTEDGTAPLGGSWWEAEVVLPGQVFGMQGPNLPGDVWKMLLAFNHIPMWMQAAIPINSGYFDHSGFPSFVLTDAAPAVQVTMDALPGIKDGVAAVDFRVHNPTDAPAAVQVTARFERWLDRETAEPILERTATLQVAPGATESFALNEPLPLDELGERTGGIWYHVTQGERELYRYYSFFKPGYDERWVKHWPPKEAFPLSAGFNPVRNNLQLRGDSYYLDQPADAQALHYTVTRDGDNRPVAEGTLTEVAYFYFDKLLQLPELKEGEYTVAARLELRDGTTLGPETARFRKLNEAKAFAEWWNNDLGHTERLIKPFTALTGRRDRVALLGREYRLNALGLPNAITAANDQVLAGSARIVVVADGKEHLIALDGQPRYNEQKPWRRRFTGQARGAGLRFSVEGEIEQDGLVTLNLSYEPAGREPVAVEALRIEFPLRAEVAEMLVCIGAGGNYASYSGLELPAEKTGQLWSTLDTGIGGSFMQVGSFYPQVWLGNEQRGLLWWADSDQGWTPVNDVPAHEVLRQEGSGFRVQGSGRAETSNQQPETYIVLRNNIISAPETLGGKRTLTFSYMASPFKPLPKGWRMAIYSENGTFTTPGLKKRNDPETGREIDGWNWLNPPSHKPEQWAALWAEFKKQADADVQARQHHDPAQVRNHQGSRYTHTSIPMYGYGAQTSDRRVSDYFAAEWGRGNYNDSMRDFLIWLLDRSFGEGGLRTVYWDIFYTGVFRELQAGYGYELPDGRVQPTFHGYNLRRFMMRLYALMQDHNLYPGANVTHSSNAFPLIAFPWIDAVMDGEFVFFRDATVGDFSDFYSPQRLRSMAVAHNFGVAVSWMLLNYKTDEASKWRLFRNFIDWHRMHDTWRCQDGRVPPDAILEWGLNHEAVEYLPYWRQNGVTVQNDNLLSSVWRKPGRAIVMVFSQSAMGTAPRDVAIKVDMAALGLAGGNVVVKEIGANIGGGMPGNTPRDPQVEYDPASGTIRIPGLARGTARYIGIRTLSQADVDRAQAGFAAIGQAEALDEAMLDWGLVGPDVRFVPAGRATAVKAEDPALQTAMWQRGDRVLVAVRNTGDKAVPGTLSVDLEALKLTPKLPWQEFIRARGFHGTNPRLDFHARQVSVGNIPAGETRWIGLRRY